MNITVLTPPTVEPVTLAQVWAHLRLTPTEDTNSPQEFEPYHPDDTMLARHIKTARQDCEKKTRRSFAKQKIRLSLDSSSEQWPWRTLDYRGKTLTVAINEGIQLRRPPILEIVSVSYYDADNTLTVIDSANYFLTDDHRLQFITDFTSPTTYARSDALRIDYWAGYDPEGSPEEDFVANIPEPIKEAILVGVELMYDAMTPQQREQLVLMQNCMLSPYEVPLTV
jgi:uncharacterized phiE125 gp8 family phage protein